MLGQLAGGNTEKYIFLVLSLLCGCLPVDMEPAKQGINIFRGLYRAGKYSDICKIISSGFQTATSEEEFIDIINEVKEENFGIYEKPTLRTKKTTCGLFSSDEVTSIYLLGYSKGIVREVFVLNVEDRRAELKGYRYDSIN